MLSSDYIRVFMILLLAHLLGDFVLQFRWIRLQKKRWPVRLLHSAILAALSYVLIGAWNLWLVAVITGVTHFLIDWGKISLKTRKVWIQLVDQALHAVVIIGVSGYVVTFGTALPAWFTWQPVFAWQVVVIATAVILLVPCGGSLIGGLMAPYQAQLDRNYARQIKQVPSEGKKPIKGLEDGGKVIGYLERLLILVFVLAGQYAGIGFLIAAKSIFRFGEFKESENRMEAEYIIIGTFASFLYAIILSQLVRWLLGQ
ncbi:MAG: DUF3307 domain-containing protein [Anaerolineaceae bacterium]|jgi:hypothetical protein